MKMLLKNCKIIYENKIEEGSILIKAGKIADINVNESEYSNDEIIDCEGKYLSPGFIDVHIHGSGGCDTMDGTYESINTMAKTIASHGTTSFLPTTVSTSLDDIRKAVEATAEAMNIGTEGANVLGVHLEGPFISPHMLGAHNPDYVIPPSIDAFNYMVGEHRNIVVNITIAPEVEGALELIKFLKEQGIVVSIGHSRATYDEIITGIECGVCHSTHLYNAMTGLHHREPGVVGTIFDTGITTETISDGIHVSYPALRTAYKVKGLDKVLLVTDAMMACCMPEGKYDLGGQTVYLKDGAVRVEAGNLAGSVLTLDKAMSNVYKNTEYELHEIVRMATINPAKLCKVDNRKGMIKVGYDADLVLFDESINVEKVIVGGKLVHC
jgi:N-acetylglucosamine-6-phosphate deacetylase